MGHQAGIEVLKIEGMVSAWCICFLRINKLETVVLGFKSKLCQIEICYCNLQMYAPVSYYGITSNDGLEHWLSF